jgi:phosphoribosylformimino-5-aminoimidazole carboxamide ribotide isomerase
MIIPCIDLMDGKVVQLVQGRTKALEGKSVDEMLVEFAGFPQIQVIDLDAAIGSGSNSRLVEYLAKHAQIRAGGGIRSVARAQELLSQGAWRLIIGTAAFNTAGPNGEFLGELANTVGPDRLTIALDTKGGHIVVKGWQEATQYTAVEMIAHLESYCSGFLCTYVDKEGMLQGTDIDWFRSLRRATGHEIIAAGGITTMDDINALTAMNIHCAVGMAIYTGRLDLAALREFNSM